jgi:hypothetical protein
MEWSDDPSGPEDLVNGHMARLERRAAAKAIKATRERWLPILEQWRAQNDVVDLPSWDERFWTARTLDREIRRLHRLLGIEPTLDQRRAKTRARVRRYRVREREARHKARQHTT